MVTLSVTQYIASSEEAREVPLQRLSALASHLQSTETGITQYAICAPVDSGKDGPLVTISAFTTASAYEERLASQAAQDLVKAVQTQNLLASPPTTHRLDPITGFHKSSLTNANLNEVFVLFAHCDVHHNGFPTFLPAVHTVVAHCEANEPGTLAFDICKSVEHGEEKGYALEIYESQAYFHDPHMLDVRTQELVKQIGQNAEFRDWWQMRVVGGFLAK